MKKIILLAFVLVLLSTAVVMKLISSVVSYPAETELLMEVDLPVHNIDSGKNFSTIQEAINDNETLDGHTILVDAGIYYEHVRVEKSVRLIGEKRNSTIIDGNRSVTPIKVLATNVTVSGFTIRNGGTSYSGGIEIVHNSCIIENNAITNNQWAGIHIVGFSHNTITNNIITNNREYGIVIYFALNNTISGNTIASNKVGIYTVYSENKIYRNNFINNGDQASSTGSSNVWDNGYPSGGNYWSDFKERYPEVEDIYSGPYQNETGSDGIWDHPYEIDEYNNIDNYPIVPEFPTWTSILLTLIVLTVAIAICKRRLIKTRH